MAHTFSYSVVALQEMNLAYHYPIIYWNCANLIVDSGSAGNIKDEDSDDDIEEENEENNDDDIDNDDEDTDKRKKKKATKTVDYGKISLAIGRMRNLGINVELPDINRSDYTFTPDEKTGTIRYGIKGITRVGDSLVDEIIEGRPYSSLKDFMFRIKVNKTQLINLIKSGCFDGVENKNRQDVMNDYIMSTVDFKTKLTLQNMPTLIRCSLIPDDMKEYEKLYNFNKHLKTCKTGIYYHLGDDEFDFYGDRFNINELFDDDSGWLIKQAVWDKMYTKAMTPMRDYLKDSKNNMVNKLNEYTLKAAKDKDASGNIPKWEMDSVGFYNDSHELQMFYDCHRIGGMELTDFSNLDEEPIVVSTFKPKKSENEIPIYSLSHIAGTVIQKNKTKHSITLLCNNEVVNVKVWDAQFTKYDKQISERQEDGKKKIIERSWFSRGNKLFLTGMRRGNAFIPKLYKNNKEVESPIMLIDDDFNLISSRCDEE